MLAYLHIWKKSGFEESLSGHFTGIWSLLVTWKCIFWKAISVRWWWWWWWWWWRWKMEDGRWKMEDDDAHIFGHHLEWASDFRVSQNPSLSMIHLGKNTYIFNELSPWTSLKAASKAAHGFIFGVGFQVFFSWSQVVAGSVKAVDFASLLALCLLHGLLHLCQWWWTRSLEPAGGSEVFKGVGTVLNIWSR